MIAKATGRELTEFAEIRPLFFKEIFVYLELAYPCSWAQHTGFRWMEHILCSVFWTRLTLAYLVLGFVSFFLSFFLNIGLGDLRLFQSLATSSILTCSSGNKHHPKALTLQLSLAIIRAASQRQFSCFAFTDTGRRLCWRQRQCLLSSGPTPRRAILYGKRELNYRVIASCRSSGPRCYSNIFFKELVLPKAILSTSCYGPRLRTRSWLFDSLENILAAQRVKRYRLAKDSSVLWRRCSSCGSRPSLELQRFPLFPKILIILHQTESGHLILPSNQLACLAIATTMACRYIRTFPCGCLHCRGRIFAILRDF